MDSCNKFFKTKASEPRVAPDRVLSLSLSQC
jgi:hypothetical protein